MLHAYELNILLGKRPLTGEVPGMEIVGDDAGLDFKDAFEMVDRLLKEIITLHIFQIADMLAEKRVLALRQANRVLEFSAHCQDGGYVLFEKHGHGNEAAGSPELTNLVADDANYRVIAAAEDGAIVHQKAVGHARQALDGLLVIDCDRLFAQVAASHHQCHKTAFLEQEVMRRRVGQKDSQIPIAWRDSHRDCGGAEFGQKHDRRLHQT